MSDNRPETSLRKTDLDIDPIRQFRKWQEEAERDIGPDASAMMTLATADKDGNPAARVVLLRGLDERGFVFFTSYASRKANELRENPAAALLFHWPQLARQVRIEGRVEKISPEESDAYFAGRPRGHQLEAHSSAQSRIIENREVLEVQFKQAEQRFAGQEVPCPSDWGGYRLTPQVLEFWQQGEHRLHDRLRYRRVDGDSWAIERLAP